MPDKELRALAMAGDGGMLMEKYFHETAKVKQADSIRQQKEQKAAKVNPERKKPNKDPNKGL